MDLREFFSVVVTGERGWFCLATLSGGAWGEEWYQWPDDLDTIVSRAQEDRGETNIYFSTYLFSEKQSLKRNVLPTRTIQADLDEADVGALPIMPTVLVQTSTGRHQGFWVLRTGADLETHEVLSRKLTYAIEKCDHSGWPLGRKVRVPGTWNYKYLERRPVKVAAASLKQYDPQDLELLPDVPPVIADEKGEEFVNNPPTLDANPVLLLETVKDRIPGKVYNTYSIRQQDRSEALWALMCALFRSGLEREGVFWVAKHSANNKFDALRYGADRELAKDVLRAESVSRTDLPDTRKLISDARKLPGNASERRGYMLKLVTRHMLGEGEFIRTVDESSWYVRRDVGRPIPITKRSEYLSTLLDLEFGLNAVETDQAYVIAGLQSYCNSLQPSAVATALSYHDPDNHMLMLHTGKRDVLRIGVHGVERTIDGSHGVVFPWPPVTEPFSPREGLDADWAEFLFDKFLHNTINLNREQALVLLKVWFLFILFRNSAIARPILALIGQPGSGKSTLLKIFLKLIYGRNRSLSAITKADDYDHAVSTDPLVVLDGVDTWEPWLPDRLSLSASATDLVKRKLYTDVDTITLKRHAMVALSAHNPRFWREDIADRLLLVTFERFDTHIPEESIIRRVLEYRNLVWGSVMREVQTVLAQPMPSESEIPEFRISDFALIGYWIAKALGVHAVFTETLNTINASQKTFSLEEEQILVGAIQRYLEKSAAASAANGAPPDNGRWRSTGEVWAVLHPSCPDPDSFSKQYKNAVSLSRKLWTLQDSLRQLFDIEWRYDPAKASRQWRIRPKEALRKSED